jgi:CxxC-x17-CxxC domain-containing protein
LEVLFDFGIIHAAILPRGGPNPGRFQTDEVDDGATSTHVPWDVVRLVVVGTDPVERSFPSMEFQDKALTCMDCGSDFVFTAGEQLFFHDKQFKNEPKRCKFCKAKRAAIFGANGQAATPVYNKVETRTVCSHCNKETTVPFRPTQGRPVLCRECFQQGRVAAVV